MLVLFAGAVVVATCVPAAVAVRAEQRVDEQARQAAGLLDAAQRGVRVTTNSADDAAAQQSAASAALAALLGPHDVIRTRMTYPLDAHAADDPAGPARPVVLAHVADWADRVELVQGRAPQAGDVVEVVAPVAAGLATGERLLVGDAGLPVLVVGTWQPRDPADPLWFADPGLSRGTLSDRNDAVGPLFTADDAAVDRAADRPLVRWTMAPPTAGLTAAQIGRLGHALDAAPGALAAAGVVVQGATIEAAGGPALTAIADQAATVRRQASAAVGVGFGAGVLGLLAAAATLEARTRRERERLLARGAGRGRLLRRDATGVLLATVLGALLGWAAATAGGALVTTGGAAAAARGPAAAAALAGTVIALATSVRRLPVDAPAARARAAMTAALVALLGVGAALAAWRLTRTPGAPDTLAQAAPLLLLVAAGLLVGLAARSRGSGAARPGSGGSGARSRSLGTLHRAWLQPCVLTLVGGAAGYAARTADRTLATAWGTAAVGAAAVAVVALVADAMARHAVLPAPSGPPPAGASAGRAVLGVTVLLLVSGGLGLAVAVATAGLVVGGSR